MKNFKIVNYERISGSKFQFQALNNSERLDLISSILSILSSNGVRNFSFSEIVSNGLTVYSTSEDETYQLDVIFSKLNIDYKGSSDIYVIWSEYEVDKIETDVLINNWDSIWYSQSDEVVMLFFKEISKIVVVTHYGDIHHN